MPILETIGSGSARGFGRGSGGTNPNADMFKPDGASRVLGLQFNTSDLLLRTVDSTLTVSNVGTGPTFSNGGVAGGLATGWVKNAGSGDLNSGKAIKIDTLPILNGVSYTFVAWYKGTQTNSRYTVTNGPQWSLSVPIFGDPRGSVYIGLGVNAGRIGIAENTVVYGGKNVADDQWHCLVWTINSSNRINAWVDGYQQLWEFKTYASPPNNRADFIGQGYNYDDNVVAPTNLDGIQVYNQVLTDAQIKEIAAVGLGKTVATLSDPYTYARYWRIRNVAVTSSHQPRWSRMVLRNKNGSIVNVSVATGDNCSDSGNIDGAGVTYTYDAGSPVAMVGGGLYTVCGAGCTRGMLTSLEYSTDGSNYTEYNRANILTSNGCGLYLTDGTQP